MLSGGALLLAAESVCVDPEAKAPLLPPTLRNLQRQPRNGSDMAKKSADKKYADGTTYRENGKTRKRVSYPGTARGDNYCARSSGQKKTAKVKARRKAWGCRGKKSVG